VWDQLGELTPIDVICPRRKEKVLGRIEVATTRRKPVRRDGDLLSPQRASSDAEGSLAEPLAYRSHVRIDQCFRGGAPDPIRDHLWTILGDRPRDGEIGGGLVQKLEKPRALDADLGREGFLRTRPQPHAAGKGFTSQLHSAELTGEEPPEGCSLVGDGYGSSRWR
jgi:hypothetical protein